MPAPHRTSAAPTAIRSRACEAVRAIIIIRTLP
jgi:hypothetical protein